MNRSGYMDEVDSQEAQWAFIRWRGQLASVIRGKRGQAFLQELLEALDALPVKRLIQHDFIIGAPAFIPPALSSHVVPDVCALGALGVKRGINLLVIDPEDYDAVANAFDVAHQLAREIEFMNDDAFYHLTPEQRWQKMRDWVASQIKETTA